MARPRTHDEALRLRLLDRASQLLSAEGPKALSLRKLAGDAGTSTTAVYALFGSKPGLVDAVRIAGFRRFEARLKAVESSDDPVEDLVRLGLAYRECALADPRLYSVMFTRALPGFETSPEAAELSRRMLGPVIDAITAARSADPRADPAAIAVGVWGLLHGLMSLETNGNLPPGLDAGAAYERALRAHAECLRRP
jgi:AcrR family transcriptional regulator